MMSMASHIDAHRPERVPGFMPARLPAVLTSWQGDPPVMTSTGSTRRQSTAVTSPRFGTPGNRCARIRDGAGATSASHVVSPPMTDWTPMSSPPYPANMAPCRNGGEPVMAVSGVLVSKCDPRGCGSRVVGAALAFGVQFVCGEAAPHAVTDTRLDRPLSAVVDDGARAADTSRLLPRVWVGGDREPQFAVVGAAGCPVAPVADVRPRGILRAERWRHLSGSFLAPNARTSANAIRPLRNASINASCWSAVIRTVTVGAPAGR